MTEPLHRIGYLPALNLVPCRADLKQGRGDCGNNGYNSGAPALGVQKAPAALGLFAPSKSCLAAPAHDLFPKSGSHSSAPWASLRAQEQGGARNAVGLLHDA